MYKLGSVIKGVSNKRFLVVLERKLNKISFCYNCTFSMEGNSNLDCKINCTERRLYWINDPKIKNKKCSELIPDNCIFKEIQDGGI